MITRINSISNNPNIDLYGSWNNWQEPQPSKHIDPIKNIVYFLITTEHFLSELDSNNTNKIQSDLYLHFKFKLSGDWFCNLVEYDSVDYADEHVGKCNIICLDHTNQNKLFGPDHVLRTIICPSNIDNKNVELYGSWDNWKNPVENKATPINGENDFIYFNIYVKSNKSYQFKFKLNDLWLTSSLYLYIVDSNGTLNNTIYFKND